MAFNESDHARWPEDTPYGLGGQFKPKGVNTIAEYRKYLKKEGEPMPDGMKGGGSNKPSGSRQGGGKSNGKSSGPARFTDKDGDGKDDRQLTSAQMKKALASLPAPARAALARYPAVLGAVTQALKAGESPQKHLNRLPSNIRGAALKAARSVAGPSGSDGSSDSQKPKDATKLSRKEVDRLTSQGWAGNPKDDKEMLYPPGHPKNPKSKGKSRKGMVQAEDGSWVPKSFYD